MKEIGSIRFNNYRDKKGKLYFCSSNNGDFDATIHIAIIINYYSDEARITSTYSACC